MTACRYVSRTEPRVLPGQAGDSWDNEARPAGATNTDRPLTRSLDLGKEGIAVKATPNIRPCPVEGCEKDAARTRSTCETHYYRLRKYGTYDPPKREFAKDKPCRVEDCDESGGRSQGYCGKHWERVKRHGSPDVQLVILDDPQGRFWGKVDKTETCWLWTAPLTYDGYGIFGVKGVRTGAHRWSWIFAGLGEIPEGMQLDHLCRVRHCVNPDHLEIVTPAENTRRAAAAIGEVCPRGHAIRRLPSGGRYCPVCRHEKYLRVKEGRP